MKTRKFPLRFAKLAVALCLVLPFLAFGLWDALLAATAPFAPPTGEALPAAGRQNATACLLYGCAHSLNQSLQGNTDGWTLDTATDPAQQQADFLGRVDALAAGGVLDDFQRAAVRGTVQDTQHFALTRYKLDAGLEQYILMPREPGNAPTGPVRGYPQFHFQAIFTADGVPVYLDLQNGPETTPPTLDAVLACAGLDTIADWQPQTLAGYAGAHGEARYSAETQLYARISYEGHFTYRLVSMTPTEMQAFLQKEADSSAG